jgi:uncharacterized protein YjbI with pentapeptide repeats
VNRAELVEVVRLHGLWLAGTPGGKRANLTDADLTDADLTRANLTDADLTDADLTRANLADADLTRADLTDANLTDANLTRANLTRANLTRANLTRANVAGLGVASTAVRLLDNDGRGYALDYWQGRYVAGCRNFTRDEALTHWSNPAHEAPGSARLLWDAVNRHEVTS